MLYLYRGRAAAELRPPAPRAAARFVKFPELGRLRLSAD
jgi:hypothetical protein